MTCNSKNEKNRKSLCIYDRVMLNDLNVPMTIVQYLMWKLV